MDLHGRPLRQCQDGNVLGWHGFRKSISRTAATRSSPTTRRASSPRWRKSASKVAPAGPRSYTWTGDDLTRIDTPDGRALEYFHADPAHPGFMTRTELVGDDRTSRQVTAAWEYDSRGQRGAALERERRHFAAGVEKWQFTFDDPFLPRQTTGGDPLGNSATYFLDGDRASQTAKARLVKLSGDCPTCGTGPNSQLFYGDATNPFRVTREVNGRWL